MTNRPHAREKRVSNTTIEVKKKPLKSKEKKVSKVKDLIKLFKK